MVCLEVDIKGFVRVCSFVQLVELLRLFTLWR